MPISLLWCYLVAEMDTATDSRYCETSERLALLLIAQRREGWEEEFEELIRREVERLALPTGESGRDERR
jgi:hypothetical protein